MFSKKIAIIFLTTLIFCLSPVALIHAAEFKALSQSLQSKSRVPVVIKGDQRPHWIQGQFTYSRSLNRTAVAEQFVRDVQTGQQATGFKIKGLNVSECDTVITKEMVDVPMDRTVVRLSQTMHGVPVFGSDIAVVVNAQNEVLFSSGRIAMYDQPISIVPQLDAADAAEKVLRVVRAKTKTVQSKNLVVFDVLQKPRLCWQIAVETHTPAGQLQYLVDAMNGNIVFAFDANRYAKHWQTNTAGNGYDLPGTLAVEDDETTDNETLQAIHDNTSLVWDYFYTTHGRDSIDNNGMTVVGVGSYAEFLNQSGWEKNSHLMYFGDGDGTDYGPFGSGLDIVAHEYGHGVSQYTADFLPYDQAGALDEAFSDIWGVMVNRDNWIIGEDVYHPSDPSTGMRYLNDPSRASMPDHMNSYVYQGNDNGGVHTNSSIPAYAYYLLATDISKEKAERIWYRALTNYFVSNADFFDASLGLNQAAVDLYGTNSSEAVAVAQSWRDVGIEDKGVEADDFIGVFVVTTNETDHPYSETETTELTFTYIQPGAKKMKVVFSDFSINPLQDYVLIKNGAGVTQYLYRGELGAFESGVVTGDTIQVYFFAPDNYSTYNGFSISGYYYDDTTTHNSCLISEYLSTLNYSTSHNYHADTSYEFVAIAPVDAAAIMLRFYNFDVTQNEYVEILDVSGNRVTTYDGALGNFTSPWILGRQATVRLITDATKQAYGFDLLSLIYVTELPVTFNEVYFNDNLLTQGQCVQRGATVDIPIHFLDTYQSTVTMNVTICRYQNNAVVQSVTQNIGAGEALQFNVGDLDVGRYYLSYRLEMDDFGLTQNRTTDFYVLGQMPENAYGIPYLFYSSAFSTYDVPDQSSFNITGSITEARAIWAYFTNFNVPESAVAVKVADASGNVYGSSLGQYDALTSYRVPTNQIAVSWNREDLANTYGFELLGFLYVTASPIAISSVQLDGQALQSVYTCAPHDLTIAFTHLDPDVTTTGDLVVRVYKENGDLVLTHTTSGIVTGSYTCRIPTVDNDVVYRIAVTFDHPLGREVYYSPTFNVRVLATQVFEDLFGIVSAVTTVNYETDHVTLAKTYSFDVAPTGNDVMGLCIHFKQFEIGASEKVYIKNASGDILETLTSVTGNFFMRVYAASGIQIVYESSGGAYGFNADYTIYSLGVPVWIDSVSFDDKTIQASDLVAQAPVVDVAFRYRSADRPTASAYIVLTRNDTGAVIHTATPVSVTGNVVSFTLPQLESGVLYQAKAVLQHGFGEQSRFSPLFSTNTQFVVRGLLCGPNPCNPNNKPVSFQYQLSLAADVRMAVYSISGEEMYSQTISGGQLGGQVGFNSITWDGRNRYSEIVPNGVYIAYFIFTNNGNSIKQKVKVAILK